MAEDGSGSGTGAAFSGRSGCWAQSAFAAVADGAAAVGVAAVAAAPWPAAAAPGPAAGPAVELGAG